MKTYVNICLSRVNILRHCTDFWRNDTACTDPKVAGDMLQPTFSKGTPEISEQVYDHMKKLWQEECEKKEGGYRNMDFNRSSKQKQG